MLLKFFLLPAGNRVAVGQAGCSFYVPPLVISQPAAEDDDDDDDGGNTAAALARLVPVRGGLLDGYSDADIKMLCRDAAMTTMRRAIAGKTPDGIQRMKESGEVCVLRVRSFTVLASRRLRLRGGCVFSS